MSTREAKQFDGKSAGCHLRVFLQDLISVHSYQKKSHKMNDDEREPTITETTEESSQLEESIRSGPVKSQGNAISKRRPQDILCGRGVPIQTYHGNLRLHELVESFRERYLAADRKDKPSLIRAVLEEVKNEGGRFLKRSDEDENVWEEVDATYAYEKVSHALRCKKGRKATGRGIKNVSKVSREANTAAEVRVFSLELSSSSGDAGRYVGPSMVHNENLLSNIAARNLLQYQAAHELAQYRLWASGGVPNHRVILGGSNLGLHLQLGALFGSRSSGSSILDDPRLGLRF
jgi:hypothetical protein